MAVLALQLPWLLTLPLITNLYQMKSDLALEDSFFHALGRSIGVALLAALICVSFALTFAWACRGMQSGIATVLMPCLLIPILVGQVSIGFLAKIAVLKSPIVLSLIASRDEIPTLGFVLALYIFQCGPMAAYVVWLRARTIPNHLADYAASAGLSPGEFAGDVFWPHCRALCQVLFVFVFFLSATEFTMTDLSIRPSVGTSTALLSHWVAEQYRIWLPAGHGLAAGELTLYGMAGAFTTIFVALLATRALSAVADFGANRRRRPITCAGPTPRRDRRHATIAQVAGVGVISVSLLPIVAGYIAFPPHAHAQAVSLALAFLWSLPGAAASAGVAITLSIVLRMSLRHESLGGRGSALTYVIIMNPLAIPTLLISSAAFRWFGSAGIVPVFGLPSGWLAGQVLIGMPLLVAFGYWLHSRISDNELDYQHTAALSRVELVRTSFLDRLRPDYLLLLLFSWSIVWNDGVINRGAASEIQSLYSIISPLLSVRPDYHAAQFCLLMSLLAAVIMIGTWHRLASKALDS